MATIEDLVHQLYHVLIGQIVLAILALMGLIDILRRGFAMLRYLACIRCGKPKIIFGEIYPALEQEPSTCAHYIPVANARLTGWCRRNCHRNEAVECQIKVRFTIGGNPFTEAKWWGDRLNAGKTLQPNSLNEIIPLVKEERGMDSSYRISFVGTSAATSSTIPPRIIPLNTEIVANVSIISEGREIGKSKWCIIIGDSRIDPVCIRRTE